MKVGDKVKILPMERWQNKFQKVNSLAGLSIRNHLDEGVAWNKIKQDMVGNIYTITSKSKSFVYVYNGGLNYKFFNEMVDPRKIVITRRRV